MLSNNNKTLRQRLRQLIDDKVIFPYKSEGSNIPFEFRCAKSGWPMADPCVVVQDGGVCNFDTSVLIDQKSIALRGRNLPLRNRILLWVAELERISSLEEKKQTGEEKNALQIKAINCKDRLQHQGRQWDSKKSIYQNILAIFDAYTKYTVWRTGKKFKDLIGESIAELRKENEKYEADLQKPEKIVAFLNKIRMKALKQEQEEKRESESSTHDSKFEHMLAYILWEAVHAAISPLNNNKNLDEKINLLITLGVIPSELDFDVNVDQQLAPFYDSIVCSYISNPVTVFTDTTSWAYEKKTSTELGGVCPNSRDKIIGRVENEQHTLDFIEVLEKMEREHRAKYSEIIGDRSLETSFKSLRREVSIPIFVTGVFDPAMTEFYAQHCEQLNKIEQNQMNGTTSQEKLFTTSKFTAPTTAAFLTLEFLAGLASSPILGVVGLAGLVLCIGQYANLHKQQKTDSKSLYEKHPRQMFFLQSGLTLSTAQTTFSLSNLILLSRYAFTPTPAFLMALTLATVASLLANKISDHTPQKPQSSPYAFVT